MRRDERTLLFHLVADDLAQRPVQDVRAGVVASDRVAPRHVDGGRGLLAGSDLAFGDAHDVTVQPGKRKRRVEHLGATGVGGDRAGVADLATRLGIER